MALKRQPCMRMPHASASATPRLSAREAAPRENSLHGWKGRSVEEVGMLGRARQLQGRGAQSAGQRAAWPRWRGVATLAARRGTGPTSGRAKQPCRGAAAAASQQVHSPVLRRYLLADKHEGVDVHGAPQQPCSRRCMRAPIACVQERPGASWSMQAALPPVGRQGRSCAAATASVPPAGSGEQEEQKEPHSPVTKQGTSSQLLYQKWRTASARKNSSQPTCAAHGSCKSRQCATGTTCTAADRCSQHAPRSAGADACSSRA